jgi:hypothetical protein
MSVRPSTADVDQGNGLVSFVPEAEVADIGCAKKKPPEGGSSIQI